MWGRFPLPRLGTYEGLCPSTPPGDVRGALPLNPAKTFLERKVLDSKELENRFFGMWGRFPLSRKTFSCKKVLDSKELDI